MRKLLTIIILSLTFAASVQSQAIVLDVPARTQAIVHGADATGIVSVGFSTTLELNFFDGSQSLTLTFTKTAYSPSLDRKIGYYKQIVVAQWKPDGSEVWLVNGLEGFLVSGYDMCVGKGAGEQGCAKTWRQSNSQ